MSEFWNNYGSQFFAYLICAIIYLVASEAVKITLKNDGRKQGRKFRR